MDVELGWSTQLATVKRCAGNGRATRRGATAVITLAVQ